MCPSAVECFPLFVLYYPWFYLSLIALGLHYCAQAFSSCRERGLLSVVVHRPIAVASLVVEHGLWGTGASVVMVQGFSCPAEYGIFPGRDGTRVPCIGRWTLNHWITREVLSLIFFFFFFFYGRSGLCFSWSSGLKVSPAPWSLVPDF